MSLAVIASIDQGTSSTRVLLISSSGVVLSSHQMEHTQHYPAAGHVEHDPLEIWKNVKICLSMALEKLEEEVEIMGIGITNQRETTVVWDKETGIPYHRAIVWNDSRTSIICDHLKTRYGGNGDYFRAKTGLPIDSYFSATKIMCLLQSVPGLREDAEKGKALFGNIDSWLMWKLTNGKVHATDVSNASRTLLMNLETLQWDEEILKELNIPSQMLPNIRPSSCLFGHVDTSEEGKFEEHRVKREEEVAQFKRYHNVPISGVLGDQQAALFGQICFNRGEAKCTYGTGAFFLMNTGHDIVQSKNGLLTTVAYQLGNKIDSKPVYALEGAVAYSGSVLQWLRDNLEMIKSASETEGIADSVPDNGGVYFVPAFAGLYSPYWREDARGVIAGLTAYNTKAHIVRAALESSAFQTIELAHAMNEDSGSRLPIQKLKVDGGATANSLLMQFQADLLNIPLSKPKIAETTALGAAYVAGLGVGLWSSLEDIEGLWHKEKEWIPKMPAQQRAKYVHHWKKALARSLFWRDNALFDEQGEIVTSDRDFIQDPLTRLLEFKDERDFHLFPTSATADSNRSTIEKKYSPSEIEENQAGKHGGGHSEDSHAILATGGHGEAAAVISFNLPTHQVHHQKIILEPKKLSKPVLGFLAFLVLASFLAGILLAQLFPNKIVTTAFTLAIGLIFLVFVNFKFEIEVVF